MTIKRVLSLFCASTLMLFAQDPYGRITGRVVDSTAAVIAGAGIRVTNVETSVVSTATTDASGNYEVRSLIPGRYMVTAESKGFKGYKRGPIEVRVGDVLNLEIALEVGDSTDSVTVTAEVPLIESASSSLSQVVDKRRLEDLPMPSSSAMYLMQLIPGVIATLAPSGNWQINQASQVSNFSTYGSALQTSEYTLNGMPNSRQYGMINLQPMPEMLQEFRLQTSPFDASLGHFTGSHVNMVTKSGTNALHGALTFQGNYRPLLTHPFFTNAQIYNLATGPVTSAKIDSLFPPTRMNRYRGTIGGPVYIPKLLNAKNRIFFVFGADIFSRTFVPGVTSLTVPTQPERGGDFSALLKLGAQYQIYDPSTIAPAGNGRFSRQPFPGNIIPTNRLNPAALQLLTYYPLSNQPGTVDGLSNYGGAPVNTPNHRNYIGRIDAVVSQNDRLFLSITHGIEDTGQQNIAGNNFQGNFAYAAFLGQRNYEPGTQVGLNNVISLRSDMVLETRASVDMIRVTNQPGSRGFDLQTLGLPAGLVGQLDPSLTTIPQINIAGYATAGPNNAGNSRQAINYYLANDLSYNRGSHSLRIGQDARVLQVNTNNVGNVSPNYTFGTGWTQGPLDNSPAAPVGPGLAAFLLGLPTTGQIDRNASLAQESKYLALYVQDDWKVSSKLTVNLGLRYELELPTTERFDRANRGFDFTTPNPISAAALANYAKNPIPQVPVSSFQTLGGLLFAGVGGTPRGLWNTVSLHFAPRIGFAYQLRPKTVLRGGYGIYFEPMGADVNAALQQGFSQSTTLVPSLNNGQTFQATLTDPFPSGLLTPSGSAGGLQTLLGQAVSVQWPDRRPGYAQRWTFGIQHELPSRVMIELGYVGNRGTGLAMSQALNSTPRQYLSTSPFRDQTVINTLTQAVPNPFYGLPQFAGSGLQGQNVALSQLLNPYPEFGAITTTLSSGYSWYHAMEFRVDKRMTHDLSLQTSFAWSKNMEAIAKLNPTDAAPSRVISTLDRPVHVVVSGLYELPLGRRKALLSSAPRVIDGVVGGWSVQAIYQRQSGAPVDFGNVIFTGDFTQIALPASQRTLTRWFNTAAGFNQVTAQQLANNIRTFPLRLSGLRSDGVNNWDLSLFKGFRIRENINFQLRAEAQDAMNHPMFSAPNTVPTSTLFGQVTSTVAAQQRVVTVGARLIW